MRIMPVMRGMLGMLPTYVGPILPRTWKNVFFNVENVETCLAGRAQLSPAEPDFWQVFW